MENSKTINCRWNVGTDGGFTIEQQPPGLYEIFAINDGAGYSIWNHSPGQRVTIPGNQFWQNITVRMSQQGGIVSGSVTDSLTGKPIPSANVSYSVLDCNAGGSTRIKDSGTFDLPIPPSCDLVICDRTRIQRLDLQRSFALVPTLRPYELSTHGKRLSLTIWVMADAELNDASDRVFDIFNFSTETRLSVNAWSRRHVQRGCDPR